MKRNKIYAELNGYQISDLYGFAEGLQIRLRAMSDWAAEVYMELPDDDDFDNIKTRLDAIQYLSESMKREVDMTFGLKLEDVPVLELSKLKYEVESDRETIRFKRRVKKKSDPANGNSDKESAVT